MKKTKILAIYYPQFHSIPENDLAWGKGFTDWVNVKKASPLFEKHYQPRIPLNSNYYDLALDNNILPQQVDLATQYGIDGFCFYHYWFDGKLLLNTPIENFLHNKNLNMSFCLSWANETWSKRWIGDTKTVIQLQEHTPDNRIWIKHFNYLIKFFSDNRYIKIDNKPVFIIYQPILIRELNKLLDFWQDLAIKNGFNGMYYIFTKRHDYLPSNILSLSNGILKFQPQEIYNSNLFKGKKPIFNILSNRLRFLPERIIDYIYQFRYKFETFKRYDSNLIWEYILKDAYSINQPFQGDIYESAYVNWDNTPRYGKNATIFSHVEPMEFETYFHELYKKAIENESEFLFINAWNEWAEGAYLEPDEKYEFKYLNSIKRVLEHYK